jgi:hypothetical protein
VIAVSLRTHLTGPVCIRYIAWNKAPPFTWNVWGKAWTAERYAMGAKDRAQGPGSNALITGPSLQKHTTSMSCEAAINSDYSWEFTTIRMLPANMILHQTSHTSLEQPSKLEWILRTPITMEKMERSSDFSFSFQ